MARILVFGEILFDLFPSGARLGGAPFNVAFHLSRLGHETHFVSRIGRDVSGDRILRFLEARAFDASFIQRDAIHPTGAVTVNDAETDHPSYVIEAPAAWDFIEAPRQAPESALVVFGTLAQRHPESRSALRAMLERERGALRLCDLNLRPPFDDPALIDASIRACDILKLNEAELGRVAAGLGIAGDPEQLLRSIARHYGLKAVCLTLGGKGAVLLQGDELQRRAAAPVPQNADGKASAVGAGDSFTSVLADGILTGLPPALILERATRFAAAVCGIEGAIPEDDGFYAGFRE